MRHERADEGVRTRVGEEAVGLGREHGRVAQLAGSSERAQLGVGRGAPQHEAEARRGGVLRHDRWKDKATGRWIGKVFVAIDPAQGTVKSLGMADTAAAA